jgi:23S rRNA (pseudouridine1915-N3)-methyltransferase
MKLLIVAVGQRMPDWAQTAYDDYAKRFPPELKVELKTVKTEPRASKTRETLVAAERERIQAVLPRGCRVVVLDERGTALTTKALAEQLKGWQLGGDDVALIIGGPDGPRSAAARVAAPRGGCFALGRPCSETWPPRSSAARVTARQKADSVRGFASSGCFGIIAIRSFSPCDQPLALRLLSFS